MNSESKNDLRKKMKRILIEFQKNLTDDEKNSLVKNLFEKVTSLPEYKNAGIIFAYIPSNLEADCTPVILDALKSGKKVCVPKVNQDSLKSGKSEMDFYFLKENVPLEEQLETGAYGIREPKADLEIWDFSAHAPSFILVPGVAFTKDGKRLGHGKGFYDIYIEEMREAGEMPFLCGLALPCQILETLPTDAHDAIMDRVIW